MNHSRLRARLNDYLERDLPPKERSRMAAHLAECPECAGELRELESTVRLLRRLPEAKVPPAFAASVMARVRAGEAEPPGLLRWLQVLGTPAFAVPLAAGLAGLVLLAGLRDGPFPQPGAEPEPVIRVAVSQPLPAPRRSLLNELARRGHTKEVALTLRGAGHPLSSSMASHFDEDEPANVAFASWSPSQ